MYKRIVAMTGALLLAVPAVASAQAADMAQGARVYSSNCTRCHNVRPPAERSDVQWRIIINHMRARANLTKSQATAVTFYLQSVNNPAMVMPSQAAVEATPTQPAQKEEAGGAGSGSGGGGGGAGGPPGGGR